MKYSEIYRFALTAAALWMMPSAFAVELPELPDRDGCDLKGYVHDGTKGVAGVLVTDGYTFATTDENGAYYLASSPDAKFVYTVLPSGYEHAVVENGVVKFFRPLTALHPFIGLISP